MTSAYSVMDSVNKYKHGVLIGNYVEDKFGTDLADKGPNSDARKLPTTKDFHDTAHSLYRPHQVIKDKQGRTESYYAIAKNIDEANYKRPQNQTSYNIFHRQQVTNKVPVLNNNPKREQVMNKDGSLYGNTRYYLSNKFSNPQQQNSAQQSTIKSPDIRQTGNIYNLDDQEIPDILTGQIFRAPLKKPDADTKMTSKHTGQPMTKVQVGGKPKSLNPHGTNSLVRPQIQKFDHAEYIKQVYHNERGEDRNVLLGHGIQINEFHRNQLGTTYDLSYNQHIKPQTQVDSFYNVDAYQSSKKFHRQTLFEGTHQEKIPEYKIKEILSQEKWGRPYDPYTKTYDQNHLKNEYLRS